MADKPKYRKPLPKRFNAAMSEEAYAELRRLAELTGLSNNYVLTALLEHRADLFSDEAFKQAAATMLEEALIR